MMRWIFLPHVLQRIQDSSLNKGEEPKQRNTIHSRISQAFCLITVLMYPSGGGKNIAQMTGGRLRERLASYKDVFLRKMLQVWYHVF